MEDLFCWQSKFESCYYSDKLIDKIILLNEKTNNKADINQIKKAIYYAKKYHGLQRRDSGELFYSHPLAVAEMVADFCFKTDILVTSILHDTIEDTNLTKKMINVIFNTKIANQVGDLTKIQPKCIISSAELINSLYYQKKIDLLIIKIFDRLHNMQTISAKSTKKIKIISEETVAKFLSLSIYLGATNPKMLFIEQKLINLIYQHLNINHNLLLEYQIDYCDYFPILFASLISQNDESLDNTIHWTGT